MPNLTKSAAKMEVECKEFLKLLLFKFLGIGRPILYVEMCFVFIIESVPKYNVDFDSPLYLSTTIKCFKLSPAQYLSG